MATVLVVDDEGEIRTSLRGVLSDEGLRVLEAADGRHALNLVRSERPELVLLDVWMPEVDGIELLRSLQEEPDRPQVIMISGHGNIESAVQATKLGAFDFIEKPFSIDALLQVVNRALEHRALLGDGRVKDGEAAGRPAAVSVGTAARRRPERTIGRSVIASGHGLHTGIKSGLILNPLPAGRGIVFANLTTAATVPAHLDYVSSTGYATTLHAQGMSVGTIEHLLATLHAYGITNLLIKVQSEVPTMDGSAKDFCALIEQAGIEDQGGGVEEIVVERPLRVGGEGPDEESISIEPADGFSIAYTLIYPPPIGRQEYTYVHAGPDVVQGRNRSGANLRLREGHEGNGRDGAGQWRPPRQLHPGRRREDREHPAALPGRVRAPQDPRHHGGLLPARPPDPRPYRGAHERARRQHPAAAQGAGGVRALTLECGSLLPLWGEWSGAGHPSPPTPKRRQAAALQSQINAAA